MDDRSPGEQRPDDPDAAALDALEPTDIDIDAIRREELAAMRRLNAIEAGRRKGGLAGAAMAGAMLALREIYERPLDDETAIVSESPDEPTDIDTDGIEVVVGDVNVWAPPPPPLPSDGPMPDA